MNGRIDGKEVYLSENELPEFTASINDILDPGSIKGTRSTTIRVIRTPQAAQALGGEWMAEEDRNQRPTLRIGEGSVDLFSAQVVPVSRNRDEIELIAVGGNASWFELAKTTRLREFDFGISDVITAAVQKATWTNEDGLLYFPLIDFGTFNGTCGPEDLRPGLRAHRIIGDILASQGWTLRTNGTLSDVWKKLVVIDPKVEPSLENPTPFPYNFDLATSDPAGFYFVPSADGMLEVELFSMRFQTDDPFNDEFDGVPFRVLVYDFTDRVALATLDLPASYFGEPGYGSYNVSHAFDPIQVASGHNIGLAVQAVGLDGQERTINVVGLLTSYVRYDRDSGTQVSERWAFSTQFFEVTDGGFLLPYAAETRLQIAAVCPSLTLIQLVQAISNALCLVWVTNTEAKTIDVWYDAEYFRKPTKSITTRDWTDRIDFTEAPERIEPAKPRRLTLKWAEDDDDRFLRRYAQQIGTTYARADIDFDGAYGSDKEIDIPFAPSAVAQVAGLIIPRLQEFGGNPTEDNFDRTARLFIADGLSTGNWTLGGNSETQYPKVYFGAITPAVALPFDNANIPSGAQSTAVLTTWKRRLDELRYSRVLECSVFIRDSELQDFDHGMPTLVDDGSGPRWYYVQEIQGHRFGVHEPTRVRLVEIPGAQLATRPLVNRVPVEYPQQPFACVGDGYGVFVCDGSFVDVYSVISSSGYTTIRRPDGEVFTVPNGGGVSFEGLTGTMCVWSSGPMGEKAGSMLEFYANGGITTADPMAFGAEFNVLCLNSDALSTITIDGLSALESIVIYGSLNSAQIDALLNAINLNTPNGYVDLVALGNAAPTAASAEARDILVNGRNLTVSGAGTAIANGEYELIGTVNGRNSYDKVGGGPNIAWDGTKWVLSTTSGSYKAEQDVAEPWMATNWTTFGASAPAPSLTQPYPGGWVVFTN